jgi:poly-gamma-glutamate synthesis protein (capsule biosynthesis protein)
MAGRPTSDPETGAEPSRTAGSVRRVLVRTAIALLAVLAAWISYWTLYDPRVDVPPPLEVRVPPGETAGAASVLFLGDFAPTDRALPYVARHGYGYPYRRTAALLARHDAVVANLEAPITDSDEPWPLPKEYSYKVAPAAAPEIRRAGIDGVTLANNHSHDYGRRGLADTLRHLDAAGVWHIGADLSEAGARRGVVLATAGGRLGLLSYLEYRAGWGLWTLSYALDAPFRRWPGSARAGEADLREDVARLRRVSDVVSVVFHFGENYEPVTAGQIALARLAIDAGADAVVGHHSHQAQPLGMYRGRPIVYSLGNYAWGAIGRSDLRYGIAAALRLEGGALRGVEITPLLVQNRKVEFQPRVAKGRAVDRFFEEIERDSAPLGAHIVRRGDSGWLPAAEAVE